LYPQQYPTAPTFLYFFSSFNSFNHSPAGLAWVWTAPGNPAK
jgi:hypothetical protein